MAESSSKTSTRNRTDDTDTPTDATGAPKSQGADAGDMVNQGSDTDQKPAKTYAGNDIKDPIELNPETHGAHARVLDTDI